jgi:hypothetical protein
MNVPVSTAGDVKSNIFIRSELFPGGPVIPDDTKSWSLSSGRGSAWNGVRLPTHCTKTACEILFPNIARSYHSQVQNIALMVSLWLVCCLFQLPSSSTCKSRKSSQDESKAHGRGVFMPTTILHSAFLRRRNVQYCCQAIFAFDYN